VAVAGCRNGDPRCVVSAMSDRLPGDGLPATVDYPSRGSNATVPGRAARALNDDLVLQGKVLGDFVLGDVIGAGGFGTVYRAEQRSLARVAVVKVIHRSLARHRDAAERFTREARLAARFEHPFAAHVYASGLEPDGLMWIAMELVRGTPLGELVARSGRFALDRFVPFFERLCEVVQAAHDQRIVHRDIKPSNIMVVHASGRLLPKLLDFGIAKLFHEPLAPTGGPRGSAGDAAARAPGLTQDGQILGSPAYMAPEQWDDPASAGPAADQYALALVAYQALSGAVAFAGEDLHVLAHQHREVPLPVLPPDIPLPVHDVLARAAAKAPDARFPTLTELAQALRQAALGTLDGHGEAIPMLPRELGLRWIADPPRPIAEAIAALLAARTASRAVSCVFAVGSLLVRWLGAMALACRSRLGPLDDGESIEAGLVMALRRRALFDGEWLDLAIALALPFGARPELCAVPELAAMLASGDACARLRALLRDAGSISRDTAEPERELVTRIAALAAALDQLGWLCDYTVVNEASGERYRGARLHERPAQLARPGEAGGVVVIDGDGARVIRLSPLVQVASPVPGAPGELFLVVGPGRTDADARLVSAPRGFEHEDDTVWTWLATHLLDAAPTLGPAPNDTRSPYPGLAAYTAADHGSFVGRERDVEELMNRLRTHALVAVVGPSGVGKTSFLAAGLIPALPATWRSEMIRPGGDPPAVLARIAERRDAPPYREDPTVHAASAYELAAGLAAAAERHGGSTLVIVDQAEELFTMCDDPNRRATFAAALTLATAYPQVRVVVAMRDDFLCRADELPAWRGVLGGSVQVLRRPTRDELVRMLTGPGRRRGFDFDDATLPDDIVREVADLPGALPLLAFAAAELWEQRDRHFRRMTRAAYVRIGGVAGALVQHADGVVDRMPAPDQRLVRLAFRRLIASEGERTAISRAELEVMLGPNGPAVIHRLLAARLVVSSDDDRSERIEVIHETLATTWPRLAAWRREDSDGARMAAQLAAATRAWDERARPADLLWRGDALVDLARWHARTDHALTAAEHAFVEASLAAARRHRRRRIGAVAAGFAALVAGILALVGANRAVKRQRTDAIDRLAASFEERGRLAINDGDDARGMLYLAEASRLGARGPAMDILASHAAEALDTDVQPVASIGVGIRGLDRDPTTLLAHGVDLTLWRWRGGTLRQIADRALCSGLVGGLAVSVTRQGDLVAIDDAGRIRWRAANAVVSDPDVPCKLVGSALGNIVVSFGNTAKLWDASTGASRGELRQGTAVSAATVDARGELVATGDTEGVVRIWMASGAALLATCKPHTGMIRALRFFPDATRVVSTGQDGEVRVCDAASGATRLRLVGHTTTVLALDVAPDGGTILSAGRDGRPRVWDAASGSPRAVLEGHDGTVVEAAISPDGRRVATLGMDGTARIWDRNGTALATLQGYGGPLLAGGWEGDQHLITASLDGGIRRWNVDRAIPASFLRAHTPGRTWLAVSGDNRWILTAGPDRRAVLWDRSSLRPVASVETGAVARAIAFAPGDRTAVVADDTGTARLWSVPDGALRATLPHSTTAAFAPDGTPITAGDGKVRFWSIGGRELASVDCPYPADRLVLDPAGRWLFVLGNTAGDILVIDVASRTAHARLRVRDTEVSGIAADASRVAITNGTVIRMWQLGTWMPLGELVGHKGQVDDVWFLPDGRLVSSAIDGTLVWRGNQLVGRLPDTSMVYSAAASPDGAVLATTGTDGAIHLWDAATLRHLLRLPSYRTSGWAVRFSRDGESVISTGNDGQLVIWRLARHTRSTRELAETVHCRVPLRLEGDLVLPRSLDFAEPRCKARQDAP
jgi:WD40 repeat protein